MKKYYLEEFIRRYDVGMLDKVVWICKEDSTELSHRAESANSGISVKGNFTLPFTGKLCIPDTSMLKKILTVLGDDIDIKVTTRTDGTPSILVIDDGKTEVKYTLGSLDVFPKSYALKSLTDVEVASSVLSYEDIIKFSKAISILKTDSFTLHSSGGKLSATIGNESSLKNTLSFKFTNSNVITEFEPLTFSAETVSKILSTHKLNEGGIFKVYAGKRCTVEFNDKDFEATYIFVQVLKK